MIMEETASTTGASIFDKVCIGKLVKFASEILYLIKFASENWVLPGVSSIARSKDETS